MKVFCLVYNLTFIVGENQTQIRRLSEITENEILAKKKKKKESIHNYSWILWMCELDYNDYRLSF